MVRPHAPPRCQSLAVTRTPPQQTPHAAPTSRCPRPGLLRGKLADAMGDRLRPRMSWTGTDRAMIISTHYLRCQAHRGKQAAIASARSLPAAW